eukprot:TRINITY_DN7388_c0_g1_i3.p1 TRINITY_DN7388_c0_g1~~TRINITY_DN7388_c0_g1_i3.p1  ORF type:complete len:2382 (+),score=453.28 TRINITY_DN7388_c0_g1_i3:218-7363(+)
MGAFFSANGVNDSSNTNKIEVWDELKDTFRTWDVQDVRFLKKQFKGLNKFDFSISWNELFHNLESTESERKRRSEQLKRRWYHPSLYGLESMEDNTEQLDNEDSMHGYSDTNPVMLGVKYIPAKELKGRKKADQSMIDRDIQNDEKQQYNKEDAEYRLQLQQLASRQVSRQNTEKKRIQQAEKACLKRKAELDAAKASLSDAEFVRFEKTWKRHESEFVKKEKEEDQRALKSRLLIEEEERKRSLNLERKREVQLRQRFILEHSPKGALRVAQTKKDLKLINVKLEEAKTDLIEAKTVLQEAKKQLEEKKTNISAGMLIVGEGRIKEAEKNVKTLLEKQSQVTEKLERYIALWERERIFEHLFNSLRHPETLEMNVLEVLVVVSICCGALLEQKLDYIFGLFGFSNPHNLCAEEFSLLMCSMVRAFEKLENVVEAASMEEIVDACEKARIHMGLVHGSPITAFQFRKWGILTIKGSKWFSSIFGVSYRWSAISEYQKENMDCFLLFRRGVLPLEALEHRLGRQSSAYHPAVVPQNKRRIHDISMKMGAQDPLKPDYSSFLEKTPLASGGKIKPLAHGSYHCVLHAEHERRTDAALCIQAFYRGVLGRRKALIESQRQEFLDALFMAKEDAKIKLRDDFLQHERSTGFEKMKWDAKVRMKQVKLRTQNTRLNRNEVLEVMMEEALGEQIAEIERNFVQLAKDKGFGNFNSVLSTGRWEESEQLVFTKKEQEEHERNLRDIRLQAVRRGFIIGPHDRRSSSIVPILNTIAGHLLEIGISVTPPKFDIDFSDVNIPFMDAFSRTDSENQLGLMLSHGQHHLNQNLPPIDSGLLNQTGYQQEELLRLKASSETEEERILRLTLNQSHGSSDSLRNRIAGFEIKGLASYKVDAFLKEFPSKCILMEFVKSKGDPTSLVTDLVDRYDLNEKAALQLAFCLYHMCAVDLEMGALQELVFEVQRDNEFCLAQVASRNYRTLKREEEGRHEGLKRRWRARRRKLDLSSELITQRDNVHNELKQHKIIHERAYNEFFEASQKLMKAAATLRSLEVRSKLRLSILDVEQRAADAGIDTLKQNTNKNKAPIPTLPTPIMVSAVTVPRTKQEAMFKRRQSMAASIIGSALPIHQQHHETEKADTSIFEKIDCLDRCRWTSRLMEINSLPDKNEHQLMLKHREMQNLLEDFLNAAQIYAGIIVDEFYLPTEAQTIKPTEVRHDTDLGIESEKLYIFHGLSFEVMCDVDGIFNGSYEFVSKKCNHMLLGGLWMTNCCQHIPNCMINVPLICTVEHDGFKVLVSAVLPTDEPSLLDKVNKDDNKNVDKSEALNSGSIIIGSADRGKTVRAEGREILSQLRQICEKLGLVDHGVRSHNSSFMVEKRLSTPADLLVTQVPGNMCFAQNFWRLFPPEHPYETPHLPFVARHMSIFWRRLRPEIVASDVGLSSDALAGFAELASDGTEHCNRVKDATSKIYNKIYDLANDLLSRGEELSDMDVTHELHRSGINIRHMGLLRKQFWFQPVGVVSLGRGQRDLRTSRDMRDDVLCGNVILLGNIHCHVSMNSKEHSAEFLLLNDSFDADPVANVPFFVGSKHIPPSSEETQEIHDQIRLILLGEIVFRTLKNLLRCCLRHARRLSASPSRVLTQATVLRFLNIVSGSHVSSERFWAEDLPNAIMERFGPLAITYDEKNNLRSRCKHILNVLFSKLAESCHFYFSASFSSTFLTKSKSGRLYGATIEMTDIENCGMNGVSHKLYQLHWSRAELCALHAAKLKRSDYSFTVLEDKPVAYWQLDERPPVSIACNRGYGGPSLNARIQPSVKLGCEGPFVVGDVAMAARFGYGDDSDSCVSVRKTDSRLGPTDASQPFSVEAWVKPLKGNTLRVAIMSGRFSMGVDRMDYFVFSVHCFKHCVRVNLMGPKARHNEWTHLVGVYDGILAWFYVNSELVCCSDISLNARRLTNERDQEREDEKNRVIKNVQRLRENARNKITEEIDQHFKSAKGKKELRKEANKLMEEVDFRIRSGGSGTKITLGQAESRVRTALLDQRFEKVDEQLDLDMRRHCEELERRAKLEKRMVKQQAKAKLRIGQPISSKQKSSGSQSWIGYIAHVSVYCSVLPRVRIATHHTAGTKFNADLCERMLEQSIEHFSKALHLCSEEPQLLARMSEVLCSTFPTEGRLASKVEFATKIGQTVEKLRRDGNAQALYKILRGLPPADELADVAVKCFNGICLLEPTFWDCDRADCLVTIPFRFGLTMDHGNDEHIKAASSMQKFVLKRRPTVFNLFSQYYYRSLTDLEATAVLLEADGIGQTSVGKRVMINDDEILPPDQKNLSWLCEIQNPYAVCYFVDKVLGKEDLRYLDLSHCTDISFDDIAHILDFRRDLIRLKLDGNIIIWFL